MTPLPCRWKSPLWWLEIWGSKNKFVLPGAWPGWSSQPTVRFSQLLNLKSCSSGRVSSSSESLSQYKRAWREGVFNHGAACTVGFSHGRSWLSEWVPRDLWGFSYMIWSSSGLLATFPSSQSVMKHLLITLQRAHCRPSKEAPSVPEPWTSTRGSASSSPAL